MRFFGLVCICSFLFLACQSSQQKTPTSVIPKNKAQWINPLFFNDNFDSELSFPLWFNDSLIRVNHIVKITKRIFPRIIGDSLAVNSPNEAMPREKREYYFDSTGNVSDLVIYYYYDDREIARAHFMYEGAIDPNGFCRVTPGAFKYLSDNGEENEFNIELRNERKYNTILHQFWYRKPKFSCYSDKETGEKTFVLPNPFYWGTLSVDSILRPGINDWIICGTPKKPYKRYKVKNKVEQKEMHVYSYWKTGVLQERIIQEYPFENKRSYIYNTSNQWISYIDSTFSERKFITRVENKFQFDATGKPILVRHQKETSDDKPYFFLETLSYETGIPVARRKKTISKSTP
jgi:hypothetical protein